MTREELEHIIRASADIYPLQAPDLADKIDSAIGEGSEFHRTYGYYAQGVGPETATLPDDWMDRVHRVQNGNTSGRVGYCLDLVDLFLSKAVAGREKDREFCMALMERRYIVPDQALELVPRMPIDDKARRSLRATIRRWAKTVHEVGAASIRSAATNSRNPSPRAAGSTRRP